MASRSRSRHSHPNLKLQMPTEEEGTSGGCMSLASGRAVENEIGLGLATALEVEGLVAAVVVQNDSPQEDSVWDELPMEQYR